MARSGTKGRVFTTGCKTVGSPNSVSSPIIQLTAFLTLERCPSGPFVLPSQDSGEGGGKRHQWKHAGGHAAACHTVSTEVPSL